MDGQAQLAVLSVGAAIRAISKSFVIKRKQIILIKKLTYSDKIFVKFTKYFEKTEENHVKI